MPNGGPTAPIYTATAVKVAYEWFVSILFSEIMDTAKGSTYSFLVEDEYGMSFDVTSAVWTSPVVFRLTVNDFGMQPYAALYTTPIDPAQKMMSAAGIESVQESTLIVA